MHHYPKTSKVMINFALQQERLKCKELEGKLEKMNNEIYLNSVNVTESMNNDLHTCIKHSSTLHFADDTNLLNISSNYKTLTKEINKDLKSLVMWLTANKLSLNNDKTELIYFHKAMNVIPSVNKIKLNGKRLLPSKKIKYLGVYLDEKW